MHFWVIFPLLNLACENSYIVVCRFKKGVEVVHNQPTVNGLSYWTEAWTC